MNSSPYNVYPVSVMELKGRACKLILVALLVLVSGAGCAAAKVNGGMDFPYDRSRVAPVFVLESPRVSYAGASSAEVYVRARQMVSALTERGVAVIGPWEIALDDGEAWPTGVVARSRLLANSGQRPENLITLRLIIDETSQSADIGRSMAGGGGGTTIFRTDYRVQLIAKTFEGDNELGGYIVESRSAPDASAASNVEPRPYIAAAIDMLADELAAALPRAWPRGYEGQLSGFRGDESAAQLYRFGGGHGGTLEEDLSQLSETERGANMMAWYLRLHGHMDPNVLSFFDGRSAGVLVRNPGELAGAFGLRDGDFLTRVNRRTAWDQSAVEREFLVTPPTAPILIDFERDGQPRSILIPTRQ